MAKTTTQAPTDVWETCFTGLPKTRKVRGREVDFPVTIVDTRWKRIKRAAWG